MLDWDAYAGAEPQQEPTFAQPTPVPVEDWLTPATGDKALFDEFQPMFGSEAGDGDGTTTVDDVIVIGDRPDEDDPYDEWWETGGWGTGGGSDPGAGSGGGGSGGQSGPTSDGQDPEQDCSADQAARDAAAMFLAAAEAENQHLSYRERAAFIIRDADGTYRLSGYAEGLPMAGEVTPGTSELTPWNVVGMVHNHPGGTLNPSGPDRDNITAYQNWIWENGGTQEFREYIVGTDGKIYVYDVDNMDEDESSLEVSGGCN